MRKSLLMVMMLAFYALTAGGTFAAENEPISFAVFQFQAKERALEDQAALAADLVGIQIGMQKDVVMVSREEIETVLKEQQLNMAGLTDDKAPVIGKLVGAQVIVVGRLFEVNGKLYITSRIISTETSRTIAAKARGDLPKTDGL